MTKLLELKLALCGLLLVNVPAAWAEAPRHVLAFYYGWYGNPAVSGRWNHWVDADEAKKNIGQSTHYPVLGPYDSHDPKVVEQHCLWAGKTGISGFIVSWWRQDDFHDQGMPLILDAAQKHRLKITAYFETVKPQSSPTPSGAVDDILHILNRYGKHPAWLKVDGKPVLFIYARAIGQIKIEGWRQVIAEVQRRYPDGAVFIGDRISQESAEVFGGIHTYNPTGKTAGKSVGEIRAWAHTTFPEWVRTAGNDRISCITIIPGYNDSELKRPAPRPNTDRHGGATYRVMWEEAIAARPNWILITSFNEWHEGSEVEPSVENGERELKTTRRFASRFLKLGRDKNKSQGRGER